MSIKIFSSSKDRKHLALCLLLSLFLHLGFLLTLSGLIQPTRIFLPFPIPVDIIELPPTPSGRIEEPEEVKRLAQRSQRVERETTSEVREITPSFREDKETPSREVREEPQKREEITVTPEIERTSPPKVAEKIIPPK
ncbi:MAG: hypothetical protein HY878_01900, partial [Deltaproteobacteria bacterium]|nr:hypothetical protein [Deltaproteobacteria bacterium]